MDGAGASRLIMDTIHSIQVEHHEDKEIENVLSSPLNFDGSYVPCKTPPPHGNFRNQKSLGL